MKYKCNICLSDDVLPILSLPSFPLNSQYFPNKNLNSTKYLKDFYLYYCSNCFHIFGKSEFKLTELYNNEYHYRPSSPNIHSRVNFISSQLEKLKNISFNRVIDVGCYNGQLLKKVKSFLNADYFIGIDPSLPLELLEGNNEIIFIKDFIQNIDLPYYNAKKPDLILSDQCFEHIDDLNLVLGKLYENVSFDSKFYICVPSIEAMMDKLNFQFIIHEHLNYFSISSLNKLFHKHNLFIQDYYIDYESTSNFLISTFIKSRKEFKNIDDHIYPFNYKDIFLKRYQLFKNNLEINSELIERLRLNYKIFGFGASDLTSNLSYFMNTDFNYLVNIIDDTPWKNNQYLLGINPQISNITDFINDDFKQAFCLVTAPQASRHLMGRINTLGFKSILIPTGTLV
jgi:hypothetical protein